MVTRHRGNNLKRRHNAVTGGGFIEQDHVAGVFRANTPAFLLEFFQHVAVTHFRTNKRDAQLFQRQLQTHIAHQSAHRATAQLPLTQAFTRNDVEDLIAIDLVTFVINHDHTVTIAIQGNTQIGLFSQDTRLQGTHVCRANFFVDVQTVRLAADSDHFRTQLAEHIRRNVVSRTVGTVHHNFEVCQAQLIRESAFAEFNVAACGIDNTVCFTQLSGVNTGDLFFHFRFNRLFHVIRQFGAVDGEEFDTVVIERVMGSGNDDARFRTEGACQIGNSRSRHWPRKGS